MFSINKKQVSMVIKDHVIRYVETNGENIISFGERLLPPGIIQDGKIIDNETIAQIVDECVSLWRLRRKKLSFIVPDSAIIIRKQQIPPDVNDDEVVGHLYFEIGESIHLPFDDPLIDANVIGENAEKKEVLLAASSKKVVTAYQTIFEEAKLKPIVADLSALSAYRFIYSLDSVHHHEHLLLVQLDAFALNLTIFFEHIPLFMRHLHSDIEAEYWSVEHLTNELVFIGDKLLLEQQFNDYVVEIERLLNFYRFNFHGGNSSVTKIIITGDHPEIARFIELCSKEVDLPIVSIQTARAAEAALLEIPPKYYDVIGLSLK